MLTIAAMLAAQPLPARAAPTGGVVTAGAGAISQQGAITTITQSAALAQQPARMVIDWNSFSSAAGESIVFRQPNAASIALNRVTGVNPSQLMGSLSANGQVFILNPNGVLFGPGSQVNVHGLLASTLSIDNASFMAGSHVLQGASNSRVVNQGSLKAANGGYVALIGPAVVNDGFISANKGDVVLASGDKVTLRVEGGSLIGYSMDLGSVNALVDNTANGVISANGGRVMLEARAADALSKAVVNHAGLIEARTLENSEGSIRLAGDREVGQMQVSGTLDASAPDGGNGGNGGFIETSAAQVKIAGSAKVTTTAAGGAHGTWLIDPLDFEIAPGNGAQTASSIGAATLLAALDNSNVTIATSTSGAGNGQGDITVNAKVDWQAPTRLTLQADRNINFNASLSGRSVALRYGQASGTGGTADFYLNNGAKIDLTGPDGTFSTQKGSDAANLKNYVIVSRSTESDTAALSRLQGVSSPNAGANFALGGDIDASATERWNDNAGFSPLGPLNGIFEGLGHTIAYLNINRPAGNLGLFSSVAQTGEIRNLGLTDALVRGTQTVGALAGLNEGMIRNSYVTGSVRGTLRTGGLVGVTTGAVVTSYSEALVEGVQVAGGLVGEVKAGSLINSYASGAVSTAGPGADDGIFTGGLVGFNRGTIAGSYSSATAVGKKGVGGLVGQNSGVVQDSYAAGTVQGETWVGGLVGFQELGSSVKNAFATGDVHSVEASTTGGLIGASASTATVINSYWNTETAGGTGLARSAGGEGKTGVQLRQAATFSGWDLATTGGTGKVWRLYEGNGMPLLRSFLSPLTLDNASKVYSGTVQQNPAIPASGTRTGTAASGRNVGTYQPYSNQRGYDISNGELVVTPRPLEISATGADKVYDSKPEANVTLLARPLAGDTVTAGYLTATFDNKNVGTGKKIAVSGISLLGADSLNYSYQPSIDTSASITPRPLEINATGNNKVYDSTTDASATLQAKPLGPDLVNASYAKAAFDDKNAGTDKKITVSGFTLSGTDAANYSAPAEVITKATVARLSLDLAITGVDKVYDRNTNATATLVARPLEGDQVSAAYLRAQFDDRNVGTAKRVAVVDITLAGADARNYSYAPQGKTSASITPRPLDITATGADKVYDGNTNAGATLGAKPLGGDVLNAAYATAAFDDKNAGTAKNVTVSGLTLSGSDAGNYAAPSHVTARATITPRPLRITATAADKTYDGGTSTSATLFDNRLAGDAVNASYQRADFADQTGGQEKTVTVSGIALAGADASNYLPNTSTTARASIRPRGLTVTANPDFRLANGVPYQGGNGVTYEGFIPGETAAVLDGQLRYGGDAQGAMKEGSYRITPGGLSSLNYAATFVDGTLTIQPMPPDPGSIAANNVPGMLAPLMRADPGLAVRTDPGSHSASAFRIADCGVRMPENVLLGECESASQLDRVRP